MKFLRFEDIIAWQKAQDLAVQVYQQTNHIKDYGFNNQIRRASISISNNIAEGYNRNSRPEFKRYLHIATASTSEVKSMTYLASRLGYFTENESVAILNSCTEISKIIYGLVKSINEKEKLNDN